MDILVSQGNPSFLIGLLLKSAIEDDRMQLWNQWKLEHNSLEVLNFTGANLTEANLTGANLSRADFSRADLSRAILRGVDFTRADFTYANLTGAILTEANLTEAVFTKAILRVTYFLMANLSRANLAGEDFTGAVLIGANLAEADLARADFTGANLKTISSRRSNLTTEELRVALLLRMRLSREDLARANLTGTNLTGANLTEANLAGLDLTGADLTGADLTGANLAGADLTGADLTGANLTGARVYKTVIDNIKIDDNTQQLSLIVSPAGQPDISADALEVAEFINSLLEKKTSLFQAVIDSMRQRTVLILGRFTEDRLVILNTIRDGLRDNNYSPLLFTFRLPGDLTFTEVVRIIAGLSKFVVADLTDARSVPQELQAIVPDCPSVPVQPIVEDTYNEWTMSQDFREHPWYLPIYRYSDNQMVKRQLEAYIIAPAEAKLKEIQQRRNNN